MPEEKRRFKTFDDYLKKKPSKKIINYEDEGDDGYDVEIDSDEEGMSSDELCLDEKEKEF